MFYFKSDFNQKDVSCRFFVVHMVLLVKKSVFNIWLTKLVYLTKENGMNMKTNVRQVIGEGQIAKV